ncbi:MAG: type III-A CRISPR-associated protein Csm2 [Magnetococcales bacterium]|nr:type III-A CRISPR-associated protein Csm2 [Magnetococcales bacterium]MBF0151302.1 type III-A CRISPR-associated protein Csm2 [Magnetococcales bacterium]
MNGSHSSSGGTVKSPADDIFKRIRFGEQLDPDLFDGVAKDVAKSLNNKNTNKPTQLRRFYDEICLWAEKVAVEEGRFEEYIPFIRMMNAKAAYAKGRNNLVDDGFVKLMNHCLGQVKDAKSMGRFKLFMEAVMGFYKELRPKDS